MGIGQKSRKGETEDCFLFGGLFSSKKALEYAMEVGAKFIGMVNKNAKLFCKDKIENLTKYWPGDYYPALRSTKHQKENNPPSPLF